MKKAFVVWAGIALWGAGFGMRAQAEELAWGEMGGGNFDLRTVLVFAERPKTVFAGGKNGLAKSDDRGVTWKNVSAIRGRNRSVNFLLRHPQQKNILYAACGNGLYASFDYGTTWKRIFQGKGFLENECTAVAVMQDRLILGTAAGLFISRDNGRIWNRAFGKIGTCGILSIASALEGQAYLYSAAADGVFQSKDKGESWTRIFVAHSTMTDDEEERPQEPAEPQSAFRVNYIQSDPHNLNRFYLATSQGPYQSDDRGSSWQKIPDFGLLNRDTGMLLVSPASELYAVTKSGIFAYKNNRWYELSLGLPAHEVRSLCMDNQNNLYAACDKGLFRAAAAQADTTDGKDIMTNYAQGEPAIREVQRAAIEYAEVQPEKIIEWRKLAARRALLPKLDIGMDRDNDRTTANSIWGTYGTNGSGGKYFVGPDDETRYRNVNWDISLTWELGDLIWSDDQTNIDVRSRLMVELRGDILDEVTKLYFERLRLKMELENLSIEEKKKRNEKALRIQELTAYLDGLTGGYFSQYIQRERES